MSLAVPAVVARALMTLLPFVIRVLRRCGVLEKDAPDVAQEVLVHVLPWWAQRRAVEPDLPVDAARGYVRVTATHSAIRHRQQEVRRGELPAWAPEGPDEGGGPWEASRSATRSPEELYLEREAAAEVDMERLGSTIDPAHWRVFHAYTVLDVPVKEIAEAEGAPESTIYRYLRCARRDLRIAVQRHRLSEGARKAPLPPPTPAREIAPRHYP